MSKPILSPIPMQTALLVFGMHRSGTSAFAGLLKEAGIEMGKDLMKAAYDNPRGFYENEKLVAINEKLLNLLGQSWETIFALSENWEKLTQLQTLETEATQFIQQTFPKEVVFALKDPRFSLTIPFWAKIFKKLGISTKQYILLRHPYEVAASLWKRNQMPKQIAVALWTKYTIQAVLQTKNTDCQLIRFESVLNHPLELLRTVESSLKTKLKDSEGIANSFIHNSLRHHHSNQQISDALVAEVYSLCLNLAKGISVKASYIQLETLAQSTSYQAFIPTRTLLATLAIDYGRGINEKAPLDIAIQSDTQRLIFDIKGRQTPSQGSNKTVSVNAQSPIKFHFFPANDLVSLALQSITYQFNDGSSSESIAYQSHTLIGYQNEYVGNKNGYFEFFPLTENKVITHIIIELTYYKIGQWAEKDINVLSKKMQEDFAVERKGIGRLKGKAKTKVASTRSYGQNNSLNSSQKKPNFWLAFLKTGLSSPIAFFKNINTENLKTLRKALLNEPPSVILSNLKKLLLNQRASRNQWVNPSIKNNKGFGTPTFGALQQELQKPIAHLPKGKKNGKLLYLSTNLPDYDTSSGGKRATRYLSLLTNDFEVYVYSLTSQEIKYKDHLAALDIQVLPSIEYQELVKEIPHFRAIICSTYTIFAEAAKLIDYYPNAAIILDTVDLHWLREERSIGLVPGLTKEKVAITKVEEIAVYQKVDRIWAVTHQDKAALQKELPAAKVDIIANVHEEEVTTYVDNGKNTLLFFGSYRHLPNISAVKKLALDIFPKVRAAIPSAELVIAGAHAPKEIIDLGTLPGVIFKGFIEEEEVATLYQNTFLSVAPLLAGAGIKGKICEAIVFRTPVVTNNIGNEGIDLIPQKEGLIIEVTEMANVIIKALQRAYDFAKITDLAVKKLEQLVGAISVKERMLASFFPEVSICIVTWNRLELLKKCLTSIALNTHYPNYKILVYSNACTDGTVAYLKGLSTKNKRLHPIFSEVNEVFVRPNNTMMQQFPANEVVLLNNDTQVTTNWLLELHRAAYLSKDFGIAGAKVLYPDGRLQEFGAVLYAEGNGQNIGKGDQPNRPIYQTLKQVGYVSGCAMYIKRSTIEKIGVFDDQYHPCYYEDSDYCYTALEQGLKTVVTPHSIIYHDEGGTAGTDTKTGFKRYQIINKAKFIQKHKGKNNGIQWPIVDNSSTTHRPPSTTFIFTHIPKCGGTSFRKFINEAAKENGLTTEEVYIPGLNGVPNAKNIEQLSAIEIAALSQRRLKVLANHSKFEEHTSLGIQLDQPFYYTLLRAPIDRFISHYNFFYYQQGLDGCQGISLDQLPKEKRQELIRKMANLQIRYLTNEFMTDEVDMATLLAKAQYNLQNHYADFGILEAMEETIQRLKEKTPVWLKMTKDFPMLNTNKIKMDYPSSVIQEIKEANYWDIQLYDWAKAHIQQTHHVSLIAHN